MRVLQGEEFYTKEELAVAIKDMLSDRASVITAAKKPSAGKAKSSAVSLDDLL
jgi:hypothetical protein